MESCRILGRAKPQTQMLALRAEELLHMRSLNSSVMRGEVRHH